MATQDVPASMALYEAARGLSYKGRFARAAEKFGDAAAAAAQELEADDSLVVAYVRAAQAGALISHSFAPLTPTEKGQVRETVKSVLLPQFLSTLTRRKEAGTLLPGSCRPAEEAWWRLAVVRKGLQGRRPLEDARLQSVLLGPLLGLEVYMYGANVALDVLRFTLEFNMSRVQQLTYAAFVKSALKLMAKPRELPSAVDSVGEYVIASSAEQILAKNARRTLLDALICSNLDGEAVSLVAVAWQRVERSGAVDARKLLDDTGPKTSIHAGLVAAAADAAVRGLRECALAGCASKEVHVSQFKCCGACRTVAYCCRAHQLEDWPAHKAACKAARKAAGAPSSK